VSQLVTPSLIDQLLRMPAVERKEFIFAMSDDDALALLYDWEGLWARPKQLEPTKEQLGGLPWLFWFICGGRGSGKTRPAAEWIVKRATKVMPGARGFIAARTLDDVRSTCVEGDSGILSCLPPGVAHKWNRTTCELVIRAGDNGTKLKGFTSEKPAQGRGPQHHFGWGDELGHWLKEGELWDQLMFGHRLPWEGEEAQAVITTTPMPIKRIRELFARAGKVVTTPDGRQYVDVALTQMTTYENLENLSATYLALIKDHEGTRMGRQELLGQLLEDIEGALWQRSWFERPGFRVPIALEQLDLIVVAIDPAITSHSKDEGDEDDSDLTGIVAGGRLLQAAPKKGDPWAGWTDGNGKLDKDRDHYCVLADRSQRSPPAVWGRAAVELFHELKADVIVGETNRGGDLVEAVLREIWSDVPFVGVNASRGKRTRAEPIATIYEQGRSHHRAGAELELLEDQLCTWVPGLSDSPDRLDACVWMHTAAREQGRFFLR
jgi:phage terminase large subunit-like protein